MNIIIKNISWSTKEDKLINIFSKYGDINYYKYIIRRKEKKPNNFYIQYKQIYNISNLLKLNKILNKRKLIVIRYYNNVCKWQKNIENNNNPNKKPSDDYTWQQKLLLGNLSK